MKGAVYVFTLLVQGWQQVCALLLHKPIRNESCVPKRLELK